MEQEEEDSRMDTSTPTPQSYALPPNFGFGYSELPPKTPEPTQPPPSVLQPPDAPREQPAKFRIRRRRTNPPNTDQIPYDLHQDVPLPTIELSHTLGLIETQHTSEFDSSLLSPTLARQRLFSPPKTPLSQIRTNFDGDPKFDNGWSYTPQIDAGSIERPSSALSVLSDSSVSSVSSYDSTPSFGDSGTSPDSDTTDPFIFPEMTNKISGPGLASPLTIRPSKPHKRVKTSHHVKWTPEMDKHLWMTYLAYQTDPEVTPFKALPGVSPPLGVCHRVARQAKRSWKGQRTTLKPITEVNSMERGVSIDAVMRENSAPPELTFRRQSPEMTKTTRSDLYPRSHSSNEVSRKRAGRWPRSEASTRRRLRELCKFKPNLPAHYQRLMQSRSPSPFSSSSTIGRRSSRQSPSPRSSKPGSSFSTDDLQLSLKANTLASMQPGNPLHWLSSGGPIEMAQATQHSPQPQQLQQAAPAPSPSSSRSVHQKSQSLQSHYRPLGLTRVPQPLASPFGQSNDDPFVARIQSSTRSSRPPSSYRPAPEEPWQIHAPRPMSGSMKRRAEYPLGEELVSGDAETRRDFLQNLFRDNITDGHRRVRSRGFSLGAMRQQQPNTNRNLSELFSPPNEDEEGTAVPISQLASTGQRRQAGGRLFAPAGTAPRLGSPFVPKPPTLFNNTFPRSMFPQGLDTIASLEQQQTQDNASRADAAPPKYTAPRYGFHHG